MVTKIIGIVIIPIKIILIMIVIGKRNIIMTKIMDITMQISLFNRKGTCPKQSEILLMMQIETPLMTHALIWYPIEEHNKLPISYMIIRLKIQLIDLIKSAKVQ